MRAKLRTRNEERQQQQTRKTSVWRLQERVEDAIEWESEATFAYIAACKRMNDNTEAEGGVNRFILILGAGHSIDGPV